MLANPFIQIADILIPPYLLPQHHSFEQFMKFALTFPQIIDIRNGFKSLHFIVFDLNRNRDFFDWPISPFFFWLNSHQIDIKPRKYGEISDKFLKNTNEFSLACANPPKKAVFMLFLGVKQEIPAIIELILHKPQTLGSLQAYKNSFYSKYEKNSPISIKDPLSGQILMNPCKGNYCQHCECFELESFLKSNESIETEEKFKWRCPICKEKVFWNEIDLDLYMKEIISEVSERGGLIKFQFVKDDGIGIWESCEEILKEEKNKNKKEMNREGLKITFGNFNFFKTTLFF